MDRNVWLGVGAGLLGGFLIGYFVSAGRTPVPAPLAPVQAAPGAAMNPGVSELQQAIFSAQQAVERDPKNLAAWVALGNGYFDTHQPQPAIDAYAKALELDPKNPDILTDQGIMYKELGAFDKAIANFEKANKLNPKHLQSLINLGVVFAQDLKDNARAVKAWKRVVELDPNGKQGLAAKKGLEELEAHAAGKH